MSNSTGIGMHVHATLTDGTKVDVHTSAGDLMRYELHAHRENWPNGERGAFLQIAYVSHSAARRQQITKLSWREWFDQLDQIDVETPDDETEAGDAGPFEPAPAHA